MFLLIWDVDLKPKLNNTCMVGMLVSGPAQTQTHRRTYVVVFAIVSRPYPEKQKAVLCYAFCFQLNPDSFELAILVQTTNKQKTRKTIILVYDQVEIAKRRNIGLLSWYDPVKIAKMVKSFLLSLYGPVRSG